MRDQDHAAPPSTQTSAEIQVRDTARILHDALRDVFSELGDRASRPVDLTRSLGLHQGLAGKLHRAVRQNDALAAAHAMPGPEALQIFLKTLDGAELPTNSVTRAGAAVAEWEHLLVTLGGRTTLDAMLTAWMPDTRKRFELGNRQRVFKAMSALKGVMTDASITTVLLHPGRKEGFLDLMGLEAHIGLRRLRPGARVQIGFGLVGGGPDYTVETIDARPVGPLGPSIMLERFSTAVRFRTETELPGESVHYVLEDDALGCAQPADLYFGLICRDHVPALPLPGKDRTAATGASIFIPSQCQVIDVFLHRDVYPGARAEAIGYDLVPHGELHPRDITPDVRVEVLDPVQRLAKGLGAIATKDIPRYPDLVRWACEQRRWNADDFRGFRLTVQYPLYGHKYLISFYTP